MGKRQNGEGNLYQRASGRWDARLSYTDPETGQPRRQAFYGRTAAEVRGKMKAARERIEAGAPVRDSSQTLAEWLAHWRDTTLAVSDRKEATRELYANLSRRHLEKGSFGAKRLDKLKPTDVEALVLAMRSQTKPAKNKDDDPVRALSDSTIRSAYTVLRQALDGAVRDGLLARNPAAQVKRPAVERVEARYLNADDVSAVLKAAEGSRYHTALLLIAATGLRRGECLALRWDAVDLDAGVLKVVATMGRVGKKLVTSEPKTQRSRRIVPLSPAVVVMLKAHRKSQLEERMRAANQWTDSGLVFCTELGRPVDGRNLLRTLEDAAKTAGVEDVDVHTLRHSAATAWLESGVHIKAVSDLLGHSSISITGDVYMHVSDDTARAAVDGLAARLGL